MSKGKRAKKSTMSMRLTWNNEIRVERSGFFLFDGARWAGALRFYCGNLLRSFFVYKLVTKYSLTNPIECGIINMSRGEHKRRKRETVDRQKRNLARIVRTKSLGSEQKQVGWVNNRVCIRKIVANIFRKPLDKSRIMWYNIYVIKGKSVRVHTCRG